MFKKIKSRGREPFGREENNDEMKKDHLQEPTSAQSFKQQMFT